MTSIKSLLIKISLGVFSPSDSRPSMLEIQNIVFGKFLNIEEASAQYRRIERVVGDQVQVDLLFQFEYYSEGKNFELTSIRNQVDSLKTVFQYEVDYYLLSSEENQQLISFIDDSETGLLSTDQISDLDNFLFNLHCHSKKDTRF
jgi:hypothetical protein